MAEPICHPSYVIAVLQLLGLPQEIVLRIVYKFAGLVHPASLALRYDPGLASASASLLRSLHNEEQPHVVGLICTCKAGANSHQHTRPFALTHRVPKIFHWLTLKHESTLWLTRVYGWHDVSIQEYAAAAYSDSYICPHSKLITRCLLNRAEVKTPHMLEVQRVLCNGVFPDECYVLGYDLSIAAWLKRAPYEALMEYAKGVSGMDESAIYDVMAAKRRKRVPSRLNSFIMDY